MLGWTALMCDSYAEAKEYSEQLLPDAVAPWDRESATLFKGCALVLLGQTEEGAKLLEGQRSRAVTYGYLHVLGLSDPFVGVCKVFQGDIAAGIGLIEEAILKREKEGDRRRADWYRMILCDVYLQIIAGKEKPPFSVLLKNLPILVKVMLTASSRIRAMATLVLENPFFDPEGFWRGRTQMILGLLYKTKKKRALALEHLTEAKRIFSQFGQTPTLARVESALAELGQ
jgi:hypothetical protein